MLAMTTGDALVSNDIRTGGGRGFRLVALLAVLAVLAAVPAMPAFWRGATHLRTIGNGGSERGGIVTVEQCSRQLAVTWVCTGRYQVNDPLAQPYPDVDGVTVVNDTRHHPAGMQLGATLPAGSHDAYLWGGTQQFRTLAFWLGVLLCAAAALLTLRRRRHRQVAAGVLVGGIVLLLAAHPYW